MIGTVDMSKFSGDSIAIAEHAGEITISVRELTQSIMVHPTIAEAKAIRDLLDTAITEAERF